MCRSGFLTKRGQIRFVFLTHVSNCLCFLIFGNQLSAVYFWVDGMLSIPVLPSRFCWSEWVIPFVLSSWCCWHHGTQEFTGNTFGIKAWWKSGLPRVYKKNSELHFCFYVIQPHAGQICGKQHTKCKTPFGFSLDLILNVATAFAT